MHLQNTSRLNDLEIRKSPIGKTTASVNVPQQPFQLYQPGRAVGPMTVALSQPLPGWLAGADKWELGEAMVVGQYSQIGILTITLETST